MTVKRTKIWICLSFLMTCVGAARGADHWEPIGPYYEPGSSFVDPPFAVSASRFIVTTFSGVFQSSDGKTWTRTGRGLNLFFPNAPRVFPPPGVRAFVIDASSPTTLYAGTSGGGVYKTIDGGGTWTTANTGLTNLVVQVMAAVPGAPGTLYAGTLGAVFKTTNGAASWIRVDNGLANMNITSLAVDPSAPSTVYAGTWSDGVFKTTDAGASWVQTALRTEGEPETPGIYALAVDPAVPGIVYAGSYHHTFRTADGGASWVALEGRSFDGGGLSIAIDPRLPSTLYVTTPSGFYRSDDRGGTWQQLRGIGGAVAMDPQTDALYRSSQDSGFARSLDRGETWVTLTNGFLSYPILQLVASRSAVYVLAGRTNSPQCLLSGCTPLFRSDDGGVNWTDVSPPGVTSGNDVTEIAVAPTSEAVVYAGGSGLTKSIDGGRTWTPAESGLPAESAVSAIAVDPGLPTTVYAGTSNGLYRSPDAGAHWQPTTVSGEVTSIAVDPAGSSTVYAATRAPDVYRSSDHGASWTVADAGLAGEHVLTLAIDPTDLSVYAATNESGTYRSADHGATWDSVSEGLPPGFTVRSFAFDAVLGIIYTGLDQDRVFESPASRIHWSEIDAPVGVGSELATDPLAPGTLFAAGEIGLFERTVDALPRRRSRLIVPFR